MMLQSLRHAAPFREAETRKAADANVIKKIIQYGSLDVCV
jgi:hypothetical protein